MNKRLEDLFDLPTSADYNNELKNNNDISEELITEDTLNTIEKIEKALPTIKGLEESDAEMDEIAKLAKDAFDDLFNLGMQTDPRFSAEIFSVGSTMLGHAITAKTAKINKKLKIIDLQLKKAELDRKLSVTKDNDHPETPLGTGEVIDRNALMKMIFDNATSKNDKKDK